MKIGIDARLLMQTGVGRYLSNLITELAQLDNVNEYYVYLRQVEFNRFEVPNNRWKKKLLDVPWHTLQEQIIVPFVFYRDRLDVVHFPYFNVPLFYFGKNLLTIHDLIIDHFDTGRASRKSFLMYKLKRMGYKLATYIGVKKASKITVISETTKKEVIDHYRTSEKNLIVTYDGLDNNFKRIADKKKAINYYKFPYILYVGNAYPHKNLENIISAVKILSHHKIKLVLAGDDDYFYPRLKSFAEKLSISDRTIFFGAANDEQLVNLYSHAKCLVFPSLMEGFGLPNLEALYCNCLPAVSDIPVFREIWGERLTFFNPYDIRDISAKILQLINMPKLKYQKTVERAKHRVSDFNWKKTALTTLNIYQQITKG